MQIRRLVWALFTSGVVQIAGIVTGLISARMLGPEGRGSLAAVVSLTMAVGAISGLSIADAVVYHCARARSPKEVEGTLGTALSLATLLSVVGIFAALGVGQIVLPHGRVAGAAHLFLFNIPLYLWSTILVAAGQAVIGAKSWSLLRVTPQAINAVLCVAAYAVLKGASVTYFLMAQLVGNAMLLVLALGLLRRNGVVVGAPSYGAARDLLGFGVKLHASSVGQNARDHLDRIIMAMFLAPAALGYYASTATLASCLVVLGVTIDMVFLPQFTRASEAERRIKVLSTLKLSGAMVICSTLGLALLAPIVIPILFGASFAPAAHLAPFLCAAYGLAAFKVVVGSALKASNKPLSAGGVEIATLIIMVVVMPPLVYWLGPVGAAVSAIVAQGSATAIILKFLNREYRYGISEIFSVRRELAMLNDLLRVLRSCGITVLRF